MRKIFLLLSFCLFMGMFIRVTATEWPTCDEQCFLTEADLSGNTPNEIPHLFLLSFAFLGGVILNLMPCVFPVIGLKIMSFIAQAGKERRHTLLHGFLFTAGVIVSFWILSGLLIALRASGQKLGWGFQLQSPHFVLTLLFLFFLFALNMSGLFEIGHRITSTGGRLTQMTGLWGSFFSGFFTTAVATPCAAPFLAPALGAALTLAPIPSIGIFTTIALGLASPYLLLSFFPSILTWLPKPGRWMESFKQFLSFPLFATVGYLLWILTAQINEEQLLRILFAMTLTALACWMYGRWTASFTKGIALVLFTGSLLLAFYPANEEIHWESWSPQRVEQLQKENQPIFVNFTARWCATCQVNEKTVFSSPEVISFFRKNKVTTLKADWTNRNPAITKALESFGHAAVPLNLFYRPTSLVPTILPALLTPNIILKLQTK